MYFWEWVTGAGLLGVVLGLLTFNATAILGGSMFLGFGIWHWVRHPDGRR